MIRVLLADDEKLIREGLRRLLELSEDIVVAAEAADGEQVLARLDETPVDVVALDVRMPRMSGLDVLDALRLRGASAACLVLTTFDDPELLIEAARRGARGFVSKDISLEELFGAIRAVAAGANWFQPTLTSSLREAFDHRRNGASRHLLDTLTAREIEVLRLMSDGLTNGQIACALGTMEGTVKNQVSSILSKMGVTNRTSAVLMAIGDGVI